VPVTVSVTQAFTDTGLKVQKGATVTIKAGGEVQYRSRHVRKADANGVAWGKACRDIASQASSSPFPAPGLPCWSLIGKIGGGKPFEVGTSKSFVAPTSGPLILGINDNYLSDNSGSWLVAVSGAGALPSESSGKSNLVPLLALAVGLIIVALVIWWALRRRRAPNGPAKTRKASPAPKSKPKPEPKPEPALIAAAAIAATRASSDGHSSPAALDPESTDVNIFKVELADRANLEVGYNFFPEETTVTWRVAQNGATFASGDFVTQGGGADRHFETIPLETTIGPDTRTVDVYFSWRIGDVPFGYNVRRNTEG